MTDSQIKQLKSVLNELVMNPDYKVKKKIMEHLKDFAGDMSITEMLKSLDEQADDPIGMLRRARGSATRKVLMKKDKEEKIPL